VFILDSLLIGSLRFVLDKIAAAAESEADDETTLRDQLLEAQMRFELGELSAGEFARAERDLLARIRRIRNRRGSTMTMSPKDRIRGVEIDTYKEEGRR
jgi:hypothetical protein